ncbi:GPI ethanolamine phosphate transferase 2-like [Actinia tenebrosa]|uniref:GPI ethanolamine phosphate transferase 2-like n=1 Tax=Actinia tenebrosa TaxID=6105 RepID=A0A6P8IHA6_ACTTE|nr:GPI ethanolamine phosphate transferase 2-like [Actinia tenebrosa]
MNTKRSVILIFFLILQLLGLTLFLKGFFPLKKGIPGSASLLDLPPEPGSKEPAPPLPVLFDRLVFVLIDALRADFVFEGTRMQYTRKLILDNNTISFVAKAHPPTVTMPRIKALMTGGIPGFVDVILNAVSSALYEDNLLAQAVSAGKRIVFFGDDTWMKLFPGHFMRSDGTTSFFVTDYTEVDSNVTRHLDKELQSNDWDIMVLHYLGLDHIGHLAGPTSPLVGPKLHEMDQIIQKIHKSLLRDDKERGIHSAMVLCGDHGMSEAGSHGGASLPETSTPLVFMSSMLQNGKGQQFSSINVDQIDVVSTLSILLGLPIPQNSVGTPISQLLVFHNPREKLRAFQIASHQLSKVMKANGHSTNSIWELEESRRLHKQWLEAIEIGNEDKRSMAVQAEQISKQYNAALKRMSSQITASLSCYDLHAMASGIIILIQVLAWLVYGEFSQRRIFIKTTSSLEDFVPSSATFLVMGATFMALLGVHITLCSSALVAGTCNSEILCSYKPSAIVFSIILITFSSISLTTLITNITMATSLLNLVVNDVRTMFSSPTRSLLVIGSILHVISLLSSSFVEEEHQTWYFLATTYFVLKFSNAFIKYLCYKKKAGLRTDHLYMSKNRDEISKDLFENTSNITLDSHNISEGHKEAHGNLQSKEKSTENLGREESKKLPEESGVDIFSSFFLPVLFLVLIRVCRKMNQTGMKWADQPDIGDWLVVPDNRLILSLVTVISLSVIVFYSFKNSSVLNSVIQVFGFMFVYKYRAVTGIVTSPWSKGHRITLGVTEARMAYLSSFALLFISFVKLMQGYQYAKMSALQRKFSEYKSFLEQAAQAFFMGLLVVEALLLRTHNIVLLAVFVLQEWSLERHFFSGISAHSWTTHLVYFWLGQVAYFAQGNSNSLSTVDIAAGYIGMQGHDSTVALLLMSIVTYCGPVLWLTALVKLVIKNSTSRKQLCDSLHRVCVTLTLPHCLLLCVYSILVYGQRYHLFVWSVFSPKLLYDAMRTIVMSFSMSFILALSIFIDGNHVFDLDKKE